jgi:hypothetical protein
MQARYPDHGDSLQKPPNSLEEPEPKNPSNAQGPPIMLKGASPMTEIKSPGEPQGICPTLTRLVDAPSAPPLPSYPATSCPQHHPTGLYPLQLIPGGDRSHVPFRLSELKEIKKDLGNYTENPDQYIQAFREVSQNFELSWKDVMLLLSQTITSLEKQQVLDQAVIAGDDYHLDKCGSTGLSCTGPSQEEDGEGKERQRHWIPKREPEFSILAGDQAVPRYDPKWTLKMTRMKGPVTTASTAFLRV